MIEYVAWFLTELVFRAVDGMDRINHRQARLFPNCASEAPYPRGVEMNQIGVPLRHDTDGCFNRAIPGNLKKGDTAGMHDRCFRLARYFVSWPRSPVTAMSYIADHENTAHKQHADFKAGTSRRHCESTNSSTKATKNDRRKLSSDMENTHPDSMTCD